MLGAFTNAQMSTLYRVLKDDAWASRVAVMPRENLQTCHDQDGAFLSRVFAEKSAAHWDQKLNEVGVPAARVRTLKETVVDAQLASRGVLQSYLGADREAFPNEMPVAAFTFAHGGPRISCAPPSVGQHTQEIFTELGYDSAAHSSLSEQGIT